MQRRHLVAIALGLIVIAGLVAAGLMLYEEDEPDGNVRLYDGTERVATINATIADEPQEQYLGLSDHESLADDEGMLFVYGSESDHTFVMRRMSFGIDIIYVDSEGCVTRVHAAPEPGPNEVGENQEYPGYGQYVLEVPIGVASDNDVDRGDPVYLEYDDTVVDGREADCSSPGA